MSKRDLTKKERRSLVLEVRKLIGKNLVDEEIMEHLNLQPHILADVKREILAVDTAIYSNLSSAGVMSDYVAKSRKSIQELDEIKIKFKNRGQWSSLVAAIKVKNDIHKDVIKLGQDLGFIDKKSGELKISGEMQFSTITDAEVMADIQKEIADINKMVGRKTINMRPEILDAVGTDVQKYLPAPANVQDDEATRPKKTKTKKKVLTKVKVSLRKRV